MKLYFNISSLFNCKWITINITKNGKTSNVSYVGEESFYQLKSSINCNNFSILRVTSAKPFDSKL